MSEINLKLKTHDQLTMEIAKLQIDILCKDKEIERLNNIINELEKWLNDEIYRHEEVLKPSNLIFIENNILHKTLDRLIELKNGDKKEKLN